MKLGIMQPYLFPYLGYFQLIQAVDRFVIYDDVNFIKGGWINRNFILGKQGPQRITLQLAGASPNKLINEIEVGGNSRKLQMTISQAYSKAPYYDVGFAIIEACLSYTERNLGRFLEYSLRKICGYLQLQTEIIVSSQIIKDNNLKGPEKVIAICKQFKTDIYINAIGGQNLYDSKQFGDQGLELHFLKMGMVSYNQLQKVFVPNLSIIDQMMFNSRTQLSNLLQDFTLV